MARPVIGITTYVTPAKWSYWETEAALIPADYVYAVERAGGRALLVPPSEEGVEETLQALDGLLFSGGSDLDPGLYDQEPHEETFGIHEARDRAELALLEAALERDMPVLAICRGSQVLNVARGGRPRAAPPGGRRRREAQAHAGHVRGSRRDVGGRNAARIAARRPRTGEVAPSSGNRADRKGPPRRGATPRTERSRRSRIQPGVSPSASSGIRKPARTRGSSRN